MHIAQCCVRVHSHLKDVTSLLLYSCVVILVTHTDRLSAASFFCHYASGFILHFVACVKFERSVPDQVRHLCLHKRILLTCYLSMLHNESEIHIETVIRINLFKSWHIEWYASIYISYSRKIYQRWTACRRPLIYPGRPPVILSRAELRLRGLWTLLFWSRPTQQRPFITLNRVLYSWKRFYLRNTDSANLWSVCIFHFRSGLRRYSFTQ